MPGQTSDDLLALFDSAPLNRRYWVSFALLSALFVLEFFDFSGRRLPARGARPAMAPDLWPIGADPL